MDGDLGGRRGFDDLSVNSGGCATLLAVVQIKGLAIRSRLEYLESHFGADGLARVRADLEPEHDQYLREGVLVTAWYPLSLNDDLLATAERLLGTGDGSLCLELGRASGRKGLSTVHSAFASKLAAHEIGAKMARSTALLWQSYYDRGSMNTQTVGDHEIESELSGIEVTLPWLCHVLTGYIGAHVEILGGSTVEIAHEMCRSRGDERCLWRTRWS